MAEDGGKLDGPNVDNDILQCLVPEPGAGLEIEDANEVDERIDKSPAAEKICPMWMLSDVEMI